MVLAQLPPTGDFFRRVEPGEPVYDAPDTACHWRTQGELGPEFNPSPPLNLQHFLNCVLAKRSAPILIKSYFFHRKTIKIVH